MTVFACKEAFLILGLETIHPSNSLLSQDCPICTQPLAVHTTHITPQALKAGHHAAVRITACGHVHGKDCLSAWLDTGHTCPTCKRALFQAGCDSITEADVNKLVRVLGPEYGEERVMKVVARMIKKLEDEKGALTRIHEQEMAVQRRREREGHGAGYELTEEDFLGSEDGASWGGGDENGEFEDDFDGELEEGNDNEDEDRLFTGDETEILEHEE